MADDSPTDPDFWHSAAALYIELERLKDRFGEAALTAALERFKRKRGHPPEDDEPALLAMRIIIADNPNILPWNAACEVAPRANGAGTLENTAKRLAAKFKEKAYSRASIVEIASQYLRPMFLILRNLHNIVNMLDDENTLLPDLINEVDSYKYNLFAWSYTSRALEKAFPLSGIKPPTFAAMRSMLARNN